MKVLLVICVVIWYTVGIQASSVDYSAVEPIHVAALPCQATIKYWTDKEVQRWLNRIEPVVRSSLPPLTQKGRQEFEMEKYLRRARVGTAIIVFTGVAVVSRKHDM